MKYELVGSIMALICALLIGSRTKPLVDGVIAFLLAYAALKVHPLCAICVATVYLTKYLLPLASATLNRSWGWVFIGCGVLLGSTYKSFPEDWLVYDWAARQILRADWFIHGLGALLLLMGVQALKLVRLYCSRPSRFLARHSFAMYVLHVPLQGSVASFVLIALGHNWLGISAAFVVSTALLGLMVLPISWLDEAWVGKLNRFFAHSNWWRHRTRPV
jgi:peptidoglycan/LPS O-acetylase OafA/YrhL